MSPRRPLLLTVLSLATLLAPSGASAALQMGVDFLDQTHTSTHFGALVGGQFVYDHEPFVFTDPATAGMQSGVLAGLSELQARRAILKRADDLFAAVDAGGPTQRLAVSLHWGAAPQDASGRRLSAFVSRAPSAISATLGVSVDGAASNASFPQDDYVAGVYADVIDRMDVRFQTLDGYLNAMAGTLAHEVGHVLGLEHVSAALDDPLPLMATGSGGLFPEDRLIPRAFTDAADAQADGLSSVQLLLASAGTTHVADLDLDGQVTAAGDLALALSMLGVEPGYDLLWSEGDIDGDGRVTASGDVAVILAALGQDAPSTASLADSGFTGLAADAVVPEPMSALLLGLGGLWLVLPRRGRCLRGTVDSVTSSSEPLAAYGPWGALHVSARAVEPGHVTSSFDE